MSFPNEALRIAAVIGAMTSVGATAYGDTGFQGIWVGRYGPIQDTFVLTIESAASDGYRLTAESSFRPDAIWTAEEVTVEAHTLHAAIADLGSRIECTLSENGRRLEGTWYFKDKPSPVTFVRRDKKPELRDDGAADRKPTTAAPSGVAFSLPDLNGRVTTLADERLAGKVVLVDVWGTWCPPCLMVIPHLIELQKTYADRGFTVVGIAFEDEKDDTARIELLKKFVAERAMDYPILDGGALGDDEWAQTSARISAMLGIENFSGFPTALLLKRDGTLDLVTLGSAMDTIVAIERRIEELLAE